MRARVDYFVPVSEIFHAFVNVSFLYFPRSLRSATPLVHDSLVFPAETSHGSLGARSISFIVPQSSYVPLAFRSSSWCRRLTVSRFAAPPGTWIGVLVFLTFVQGFTAFFLAPSRPRTIAVLRVIAVFAIAIAIASEHVLGLDRFPSICQFEPG